MGWCPKGCVPHVKDWVARGFSRGGTRIRQVRVPHPCLRSKGGGRITGLRCHKRVSNKITGLCIVTAKRTRFPLSLSNIVSVPTLRKKRRMGHPHLPDSRTPTAKATGHPILHVGHTTLGAPTHQLNNVACLDYWTLTRVLRR